MRGFVCEFFCLFVFLFWKLVVKKPKKKTKNKKSDQETFTPNNHVSCDFILLTPIQRSSQEFSSKFRAISKWLG